MKELAKFLIVGALNTLIGLSCIYAAMGILHLGFIASNALGYGFGILISFALNRAWTFGHSAPWRRSFPKWLAVVGAAYACNLIAASFARWTLGVDPYIAQLFGVAAYTSASFLGARQFVFSTPAGAAAP